MHQTVNYKKTVLLATLLMSMVFLTGGRRDQDTGITGEIFVMPKKYELPAIADPGFISTKGSLSGKEITLTSSSNGKYNKIDISKDGKLTIQGDVTLYITGDIELKNGAQIEIAENSSLKLYFDGDIEAKNSSGFNNLSKIPSNVRLYGTGDDQTIALKNESSFYGVVLAPNADMTIHNSVKAYGAFLVNHFELKNGGEVYYDEALKNTSLGNEGISFTVTRWEEL